MKKLGHEEHGTKEPAREFSRRKFFKLGAAAAVLATLNVGGMVMPAMAKANTTTTVEGRQLTVIALSDSLANLDQSSRQYRGTEQIPNGRSIRVYTNEARNPGEVRFLVTLDHDNALGRNNLKGIVLQYPRERDRNPDREGAGTAGYSLTDFANYIQQISGVEMRRVRFYIETGTFEYNGRETVYTTAYVLPLDANGNIINRRNAPTGQFIAYISNYYADYTDGGIAVLQEPVPPGRVAQR